MLKPALEAAGFRIDHSEGGLYLWATEGVDAWESMARLADLGILEEELAGVQAPHDGERRTPA